MKKMAIVSSYNELCGNATYTEVLRKGFSKYYSVDVLGLRTDILGSNKRNVSKLADCHIKEIAKKLREYDYVNIQFEAGLYGTSRANILKRVKWLIRACDNLTFTMHRVDIADSLLDKEYLKKLMYGNFFKNLKQFRQNTYMAKTYEILIRYIKRRSKYKNLNIIVHTKREKRNIRQIYGFKRVYDFPITFMDEHMRKRKPDKAEKMEFHKKYGLEQDDIVIGLFGFISEYKGHEVALKALKLLPANYKIIVFGSQHPMGIMKNVPVDPYIDRLIHLIEENSKEPKADVGTGAASSIQNVEYSMKKEKERLDRRVFFAGSLDDQEFIDALYVCDFAVLPYMETNQSGSGIASLVLESKIKALYSNNKAFFELQKYYPDTFETFDIGNYNELAYKIRNYHKDYTGQIDKCLKKYNLENNILFQKAVLEGRAGNERIKAQR